MVWVPLGAVRRESPDHRAVRVSHCGVRGKAGWGVDGDRDVSVRVRRDVDGAGHGWVQRAASEDDHREEKVARYGMDRLYS